MFWLRLWLVQTEFEKIATSGERVMCYVLSVWNKIKYTSVYAIRASFEILMKSQTFSESLKSEKKTFSFALPNQRFVSRVVEEE